MHQKRGMCSSFSQLNILKRSRTFLFFVGLTSPRPAIREWARQSSLPRIVLVSSGTPDENRAMNLKVLVLTERDQQLSRLFAITGTPSAVLIDEKKTVSSGVAVGASSIGALEQRNENSRFG